MRLNEAQQEAVEYLGGPMLIIAGAGTGKTTVITERIRYLIQEHSVSPDAIFAATFTQKASEELLSRLDDVMPLGYREPWIGTFHSLCDRLLKHEALEVGLDPHFRIMTTTDQWMFIKEHLFDFNLSYYRPLGNPAKFISALITFFSRLQDEVVSPNELEVLAEKKLASADTEARQVEATRLVELAQAYQYYSELKQAHSVLDFGDLITRSISLLQTRPNLLEKYQNIFEHVLVDEFQDTNYAQYQLIQLLKPPSQNPNLAVVGDDDQAIYRFRGASVSNILDFKDRYPDAHEIVLTKNYRSVQPILDGAYLSILHNNPDRLEVKLAINKKLISSKEKNGIQMLPTFEHIDDEVGWTISQIEKLVTEQGLAYKDIAILARSNAQLSPYVVQLKAAGIPYQLVSNRGLFDQPEVVVLMTWLRVLVDPDDTISLFHIATSSLAAIDTGLLLDLMREVRSRQVTLWELFQESSSTEIQGLVTLIESHRKDISTISVQVLLHNLIEERDYLQAFITEESVENQLKIANLNLFFNRVSQFEKSAERTSALHFLDTLDQWMEAGENPAQAQVEDIDTVSLLTVHASKGLEFEAVFVGSLIAGRFPSIRRKDPIEMPDELVREILPEGDAHMQEERRLFYVALTRARSILYLTSAKYYGGVRARKPSGFLAETGLSFHDISKDADFVADTVQMVLPEYLSLPLMPVRAYSYSQLDTFSVCPLKYKYRYLLKVPARAHHALSFGQTIHATLYDFHRLITTGKDFSKRQLLDLYESHFIDEGYESREHKKQRFESGSASLSHYFDSYSELFGEPKYLEQSFTLQVDDAVLVGKIDRIDITDQGYELIDYKTGSDKDQKSVDRDEQLTLYALASREVLGIELAYLHLYFIETNTVVTTTRTSKQLDAAHVKLTKKIAQVKSSDYPPSPGAPFPCGYCEYRKICPYSAAK